jgi:hypothetical protein
VRYFWLALLVLAGCVSHARPREFTPKYYHPHPLVRLRMHADVDFTPLERGLIEQAVNDLEWQTAGLFTVDLEYDLDFSDVSVLRDDALLVRQPEFAPLTLQVDQEHKSQVLGFTRQTKSHCFLVADRLPTPDLWRHVAMHELLHAAGLLDLVPTRPVDIMAKARVPNVPLCMSRADAIEFCRVNHCNPERLNYCRPPT